MSVKADYVKANSKLVAGHTCHWTGCSKLVPPSMAMCKSHWFKLPGSLRRRVWASYQPGQEITKTPSHEYVAVMKDVIEWISSKTQSSLPPMPTEVRSESTPDDLT